jgi:cell division protein FtsL
MIKLLNAVLVFSVIFAATIMYSLEHSTRALERDIANINRQIEDKNENFKLLKAEWSNLTRPERIAQLARQHLHLEQAKAMQYLTARELMNELADISTASTTPLNNDSIQKLLQGDQ